MTNKNKEWSPLALVSLGVSLSCVTGAVVAEAMPADVTGGFTVITQSVDRQLADSETTGSLDVTVEMPVETGAWVLYVEGSSIPAVGGVSGVVPEANTDLGTASVNGEGHVQVSEFKYRHEATDALFLTTGVLDATAYMDFSLTSNDENNQFLGASFVNNPTIAFPDYSFGFAVENAFDDEGSGTYLLAVSSHGISDNPSTSYTELLDVGGTDKGAFVGVGARWVGALSAELGGWTSTVDQMSLDGTSDNEKNYGMYATLGGSAGDHAADIRIGAANPKVSVAALFGAASYAFNWDAVTFGLGVAQTKLAEDAKAPGRADITQAELYVRYAFNDEFSLTVDAQQVKNPAFDESVGTATVTGARLHYEF